MEIQKLLYAEDHVGTRRPVAKFLRMKDYEVVETRDPTETIRALSEETFDLLLLDLRMPENNPDGGKEVLEHMKQHGMKTPVVIFTAYGYNGLAADARSSYSDLIEEVVCKPADFDLLLAAIEGVLAERQEAAATEQ